MLWRISRNCIVLPVAIAVGICGAFAADESRDSAENVKLGTRVIKGRDTTVFIAYHGPLVIIQVSVQQPSSAPAISFDEVTLKALSDDGSEIPTQTVIPNAVYYGKLSANSVGAYKLTVEKEQRLSKITVQRGTEVGVFTIPK